MSELKLFESLYNFLNESMHLGDMNKCIDLFVNTKSKSYFENADIYSNLIKCEWAIRLCASYGASSLTLFLAKIRKSSQTEWGGLPCEYNKNLNVIKLKVADTISDYYIDKICFENTPTKKLLLLLPILPNNKNNNISNVVLSYLAVLREKFSDIGDFKLIITNELDFSLTPLETVLSSTPVHQFILENYGGCKLDILHLKHDENLPSKLIEEVNKFSPTDVFVPNFELTCSYIHLLRKYCYCIFMQTNIKNQTPYEYDLYLSCGEVGLVPTATVSGRKWQRFNFGYPKFGFSKEEIKLNNDAFRLVFVSNRLETELSIEYLSQIDKVMNKYLTVELHLVGVRNETRIRTLLENNLKTKHLKRIKFIGYITNVGNYLQVCDAYVNPLRLGGGVSMALSLYADTPVLLNGESDAANFLGGEGVYDNYEDQFRALDQYIMSPKKMVELLGKQKKYFLKHNSPFSAAKQIIKSIER